ncbi:endonuclease NucS [Natrononativus amylolyticus]|uniref:endonuclease NucS n=1 Tax=Natrononativus amylolyticus TaxID=2963434 RepID=UPI0020CEC906|nr:endonuclease NucS [Natrononativus amylolyticus]
MTSSEQETRVATVEEPTPVFARETIAAGLEAGALVTIVGRCTVEYDGRATSRLEAGDRHVMLKPDGTVLVHTAAGQQPVNWQPPGCEQEAVLEDGSLSVRSRRSTPEEHLLIAFESVAQVSSFALSDSGDLSLAGTEADLKDRILERPDLLEDGFTPLATERETPAGAVDIYGEDRMGRSVVVELKRRRVGPDAVSQLRRYVDALERDLHADTAIRGILVAPSVTDRAERLLAEHGLEFVSLEPTSE